MKIRDTRYNIIDVTVTAIEKAREAGGDKPVPPNIGEFYTAKTADGECILVCLGKGHAQQVFRNKMESSGAMWYEPHCPRCAGQVYTEEDGWRTCSWA